MAHTVNPNAWEAEAGWISEFQENQVYTERKKEKKRWTLLCDGKKELHLSHELFKPYCWLCRSPSLWGSCWCTGSGRGGGGGGFALCNKFLPWQTWYFWWNPDWPWTPASTSWVLGLHLAPVLFLRFLFIKPIIVFSVMRQELPLSSYFWEGAGGTKLLVDVVQETQVMRWDYNISELQNYLMHTHASCLLCLLGWVGFWLQS